MSLLLFTASLVLLCISIALAACALCPPDCCDLMFVAVVVVSTRRLGLIDDIEQEKLDVVDKVVFDAEAR